MPKSIDALFVLAAVYSILYKFSVHRDEIAKHEARYSRQRAIG